MLRHALVLTAALTGLQACASLNVTESLSGYRLALAVAPSGQVTSGSKAALERAVRSGQPVRVGFGIDFDNDGKIDLEHWADARFITVLKGEVFTQLAPIQEQSPQLSPPQVQFATKAHPWTGMVDTTGRLRGWFPGEAPSERRVTTWWYVLSR